MARTMDRPRLSARAMVSSRARARAWECVYVKRPDHFCRRTKFNVTVQSILITTFIPSSLAYIALKFSIHGVEIQCKSSLHKRLVIK